MIDPETVVWIETAIGAPIARTVRLPGGMSSQVHRCWLADGTSVVVRHITDRDWLSREPYLIASEATALELLRETTVPAPEYIASDEVSGRLMMSFVEGEMVTGAAGLSSRLSDLATLVHRIGSVDLPHDHGLVRWRPWAPASIDPPGWGDDRLWREAIDAFVSIEPPEGKLSLLHRDFHPLNVLWNGRIVSGVVDWVNACVGHPHAELGHCRWNLAVLAGPEAADAFLHVYLSISDDAAYTPYWDLATVIGLLPGPIGLSGWHAIGRTDVTQQSVVTATEDFLVSALRRL